MSEMPPKILDAFKRAFSLIPQSVVWQWRGPRENYEMPSNVYLSDWLPQQDILGKHYVNLESSKQKILVLYVYRTSKV